MSEYIHGGSDEHEVKRLEKQAQWGAPWMLADFKPTPNARVLDLATGVGAMAGWLLEKYPTLQITGVDLSLHQLQWARRNHPTIPVAEANGAALPFADRTFDFVHCSWLLEHVPSAVAVKILREVHRVLKPGGHCHFTEVENSTFRVQPAYPEVMELMASLNDTQAKGGGDPYVGRQLPKLFAEAGFTKVDIRPFALHGSSKDPVFFQGFIDEFAEIFESLDEALPGMKERAQRAAALLRGLPQVDGSLDYSGTTARGFR